MMQTVVETRHYMARAEKILSDAERHEFINVIASQPLSGVLLVGTGGIRKMRFARGARGKSAGVRVIYFVHDLEHPIFLLEIFAKNEKANLSSAERNALADFVQQIKEEFRRGEQ